MVVNLLAYASSSTYPLCTIKVLNVTKIGV